MTNDFLKSFNDGIPIYKPIDIYLNDLGMLSSKKEDVYNKISLEYEQVKEFILKYTDGYEIDLFLTICITSNTETLEREFHFSPNGFINSLLYNLNLDNICNANNYKDIFFENPLGKDGQRLNERIKLLRNIRGVYLAERKKLLNKKLEALQKVSELEIDETLSSKQKRNIGGLKKEIKKVNSILNNQILEKAAEKELLENYPYLKSTYELFKSKRSLIREAKRQITDEELPKSKRNVAYNNLTIRLKRMGFKKDIDTILEEIEIPDIDFFIETYSNIFEKIIENTPEIIDFLLNYKINIEDLGIQDEKLELYIANQTMESCENNTGNDRQNYIYYVTNYFKNEELRTNDRLSITIEADNAGNLTTITPKTLFERYENFLLENPDIRPLDLTVFDFSGMELNEIQDFITVYLEDLRANWVIIPKEKFDNEVKSAIGSEENRKYDNLQRNLLNQFVAKTEFYATLDPYHIIKGINTFEGYRGFVFTNGKVVLEKFYDDVEKKKLTYGAAFIMKINDFHELSKQGIQKLRYNPRVKRVVHDRDWKNDILTAIGNNNDRINPAEEVKRLIKTGEINKEN